MSRRPARTPEEMLLDAQQHAITQLSQALIAASLTGPHELIAATLRAHADAIERGARERNDSSADEYEQLWAAVRLEHRDAEQVN